MTTDLELNKKRLEVKNEINEGINKTPMALLFNITGRLVQKILRYPKPLSFISCVVALVVMTLLILGVNYLLLFRRTQATTQITPISAAILVEITLVLVAATYFNINMVLSSIRDGVVDSILSTEDLSKLHEWLSLGWSPSAIRNFFFWWVLFIVGALVLLGPFLLQQGFSANFLIPSLLFAALGGVTFYYAPLMILLPTRLGSYHFKLYENDPAHSEIVGNISTILNRFTYGYVFLNVLFQLSLAIVNLSLAIANLPLSCLNPLFVFKSVREKSFPTSDFMKWIVKKDAKWRK